MSIQWLAAGVALGALLLVLLALLPMTLSANVQGKAEPSGAWAVACGLGLGPLALSAIAAAGVKPFLTCHLFGKQVVRVPLSRWVRRGGSNVQASPPREPATEDPLSGLERGLFRVLDPLEVVLSWWDEGRIFQVGSLIVDVQYSFRDIALTGRILAGLYMLSAVLPARCEIRQTPSWESEDRVALGADAKFKIWPGRLLRSVGRFVLKRRTEARQSARLAKQATHST